MKELPGIRKILYLLMGFAIQLSVMAQQVPSHPLSVPVYHPLAYNPAFTGSKDFTNITLTSKVFKNLNDQLLSFHQRLSGTGGFFSNLGMGVYTFREHLDQSWNAGLAVTGAYHLRLDEASVHNLGIGAAVKGVVNGPLKGEEDSSDTLKASFSPDADFGLYYYGPNAFGGISVTSMLGSDPGGVVSRSYHLHGGYKFLLSRRSSIVLEPSLLISLTDSTISEPHRHMVPYLKLYLQNFYIGTYLKSVDVFALFFQYQFPRFNTGLFLEFPRIGFLNNDNIIFELSLGLNLGHGGEKFLQYRHW